MLSRIVSLLVFFICIIGSISVASSEEKDAVSRVVFLPFDISAAGKYAALEAGLQNMLVSRLAIKDRVEVVDYSLDAKEVSRLKRSFKKGDSVPLFQQLNADYLVSGALFALDRGLQMQVVFHPASKTQQTVNLSIVAEGDERIIDAVDQLSQKIAEKVFGYESHDKQTESLSGQGGAEGFRTDHPERRYKKGVFLGETLEGSGKIVTSKGIRRSLKIPMRLVSMALGDLDGDGAKEIILAGSGELRIFQFQEGVFKKIDTIPVSKMLKMHAINLADLNNDGRKEIYVSANEGFLVSSFIMEWSPNGGGKMVLQNIPWYIRPLEIPGEGVVIAGQNRGVNSIDAVRPGIFRLQWSGDGAKLLQGEVIPLPKSVNLFNFVLADLDGDGSVEKIVVNRSEKILVYDQTNRIKWVSSGEFGGSRNYLGPLMGQGNESGLFNSLGEVEEDERDLTFVPTRLIVTDINNDQKPEIVIGRNKLTSWRFMENLRSYDGGFISCLAWKGKAMVELWRTNVIDGYVADYSFTNVQPAEGTPVSLGASGNIETKLNSRLYVGQIPDRSIYGFLTQGEKDTRLLSYELDFQGNEANK